MRLLIVLLCLPALMAAQESRLIKGKITDGSEPLPDVTITIEGEETSAYTNSEGRYEIEAETGDILHYNYTGMKEIRLKVEDVTRFLNLVMVPEYTELEEVTMTRRLKSQQELQQEYPENERIIRTSFGFLDPDATPGRVISLTGDQINPIGICLLDYLRNRFANLIVQGSCSNPETGRVFLRTQGSILNQVPAIFDVDGMIYTTAAAWLDINQIERMAIIYNRSMAVRYGSLAAGGVIVINTVNSRYAAAKQAPGITTATTKKSLSREQLAENAPTYLKEMRMAGSNTEAQQVYQQYAEKYSASPFFFLDAYEHFYSSRSDREFADLIIADNQFRFAGNAVILKALGYLYQEQGREEKARDIYKEVFILRPEYSQSYLDMANAYRDTRQYAKAAALLGRYQYLLTEGYLIGSDDFWLIQQHDSDNLFAMEGENLGTDMRQVTTDPYLDGATRLVFEWNDSEAEFELQFINPNGATYDWKHTYADNSERIEDEKISGYGTAEYVIDPSTPGPWQVNVTYLGNKSLTPSYLKVTTYTNFGTSRQQKQVETFKLFLKGASQELMTLNNPLR
ncbi:carboxypeptidase-like regulatory domain-containing protein [Robiginitalea sp. SC105]|uniref:carboxypeptidase-like regulatory domain-containing protein n=1 Tax=Robiginitalea sp. SC105 TaxID=2762332 RepID=UPI001639B8F3|nr:carboxypeptidase-like regulatory domain-containing protein [Robiginitalea sp. SC105]MBC2840698.1 carboxypeptidase-like regulatory domain-containing protein [Robiginitalea sp. SC105]